MDFMLLLLSSSLCAVGERALFIDNLYILNSQA